LFWLLCCFTLAARIQFLCVVSFFSPLLLCMYARRRVGGKTVGGFGEGAVWLFLHGWRFTTLRNTAIASLLRGTGAALF
jgi:hypothetical protein